MRARALALVLSLAAAALLVAAPARAEGARVIDLFTIGYGKPFYTRYGHSLLCVMEAATDPPRGDCYDYGVTHPAHADSMVTDSIRGKAIFITAKVPYRVMIDSNVSLDRTIQRQRLPLSSDEVDRLASALETSFKGGETYAYHPATANCSTKVRDVIDHATGGRLSRDRVPTREMTYREVVDQGLVGHPLELAFVALASGTPNERYPDSFEAQFLPRLLRDAVEQRFGVKPEMVHERVENLPPLSTGVGRGLLALVGLLVALTIYGCRRNERRFTLALRAGGILLGDLGILLEVIALVCVYPETRYNWSLVVLLPTDLAIGWLPRRWLSWYAMGRLALLALLVVLELAGVVHQLVIPVALLAGLPLVWTLKALREPAKEAAAGSVQSA
jgi:hypothetical protein